MKTTMFNRMILGAVLAGSLATQALALSPAESSALLYMKQEEKLARDVYQALHARWGHITFERIQVSEQRHMEAMDRLIARYRLVDATPAEPGRFTYPQLQSLYDELMARGTKSLGDALAVGVLVEKTDIADLQAAIDGTKERPIRNVLGNLMSASHNHLAAFERWSR